MAIVHVGSLHLTALSTDTLPTSVPEGYTAMLTDTKETKHYLGGSWVRYASTNLNHMDTMSFAQFMDIVGIAIPSNPASGTRRLFVDTTDGKLKVRNSSGTNTSLEESGGGARETHVDLISLAAAQAI